MKRILPVLSLSLLPLSIMAQSISIDETSFPDAKFRQFVLDRIDKDDDNLLSQEEIDATASLEIQYKGISDLKGIEFFTELETLYCDGNNLSCRQASVIVLQIFLGTNHQKLILYSSFAI